MLFVIIALASFVNFVFNRKKIHVNTGSMAIIMALGIVNFGVLHLPVNHSFISNALYDVTLFLCLLFWMNMIVTITSRSFAERQILQLIASRSVRGSPVLPSLLF